MNKNNLAQTAGNQDDRPNLVYEARKMLLARWAKYSDPKNLDWDWEDVTNRWERHAINAVLDLERAERRIKELEGVK